VGEGDGRVEQRRKALLHVRHGIEGLISQRHLLAAGAT
jgi:hypothetical protein